ncbi:MAG: cobyrinic acid a,c-diamide synthase [Rhodospirillales bacterium]|nr:cobyrinic acid a,c-diamide synthase [Rhodospirillales bacterium]
MTPAIMPQRAPGPNPQNAPRKRNVVAVASGKGGVGKTWFSITLAHALARAGHRTLLFDGDLGLANIDVQLGVAPQHDLGAVIAGKATMAQVVERYEDGGFDVIAGRSGSGNLASLPMSRLVQLRDELHEIAQGYDHVVLDLGAGVERAVRILVGGARTCLVVATDEPTSITDAYAFIKVTALDHLADDIRIIVNMASGARDGERTYATLRKACREFLKIEPPLAGIIRRDDHVKDSIRRQTSLLTRHPNTEAAHDVESIAAALAAA